MSALDAIAAEGRAAGALGRPISDCPAKLDDDARRAWRAGWRCGHDWLAEDHRVYEAAPATQVAPPALRPYADSAVSSGAASSLRARRTRRIPTTR